ncbi:phage major tail tube protein [Novosphingobium sp. FSY-8]|uniref:Phage major tail tube protein n=1 Tax=Novosphingobium ovatum TaxID=1908523 RepID=A0ABW9XAI0_9SPHN|nr:phage major tail tube protein [Novosphingobium ovatum]NBC35536.1 phage major tail tube protein [Novosphingobium ovatum]
MGLPRECKNWNIYGNGASYLGIASEFEEPKLAIAMEDMRNGGMIGPVKVDRGLEAMEASATMSGHVVELIRNFGTTDIEGTRLRFVGAYQSDDGSAAQAVEIYMGGRFQEIDFGKAKPKDGTEHKFKLPLNYYRRVVDGTTEVEIDMLNGVFIVGGIDRYAEIMAIITS